jgi:PKD repeat protein
MLSQSAHDGMLSQSYELSVVFEGIRSVDIDLTFLFFWKKSQNGSLAKDREVQELALFFNYQDIKKNIPTYKINLNSTANIAVSNPAGGMVVCF